MDTVKGKFEPKTLLEVVQYFSDENRAFDYLRNRRWPNGTICPRCQSRKVHLIESRRVWRCNGCRKQFSVKVGTIFEDSPVKLSQWLPAMWLLANCKNGISSYELGKDLGVTQKTAWFMLQRLRLALQDGTFVKLGGNENSEIEVDETYIGGKAQNMHANKRHRAKMVRGLDKGKQIVLGIIEREGRVKTYHVSANHRFQLVPRIVASVQPDTAIYSDAWRAYASLSNTFKYQFIDKAVSYVNGRVHTNNVENYWSLLKRTLSGTYVSVEPFHLFRYLDEQSFRFNTRKVTDGERFFQAMSGTVGKRLTYNQLTGKEFLRTASA